MTDPGSKSDPIKPPASETHTSFFSELRKRRVYRAALAYAVVAWGSTEILDGVITRFGWPDWWATLTVVVFVVGFPVAMFLSWVFDWTREGIRRTEPWSAAGGMSITVACVFLVAGSCGLFWLINPSGVARIEKTGVAVLPCRYRGEESKQFRGEGFAEMIHEQLAHSGQLFIPEFATVVTMSANKLSTTQLAGSLNVSWLVECRVIEEEQGIRLDVTLIDTASDDSESLTSTIVDTLDVGASLDIVNQAILEQLDRTPVSGMSRSISDRFPPGLRAVDSYLKGEQAMRRGTVESVDEARQLFRSAQIAPDFYLARIREADALMLLIEFDSSGGAKPAVLLKAVSLMLDELDGVEQAPAELYASHLRLAGLADKTIGDDRVDAEQRRRWFERAIALKPNDATPYLIYAEYLSGKVSPEDAAIYSDKASTFLPTQSR